MKQPTQAELLQAAQVGNRSALAELLDREQSRIFRFGMKMCGDPEDAADVLQETMLAVARSVASFRGGSSFSSWLYAIARSHCSKKHRRSKFAPSPEATEGLSAATPLAGDEDPEAHAAERELSRALNRAISALAPKYREVLVLRDVEGLTTPEVAETLALGIPAVKSRLHRARSMVRQRLLPYLSEHEGTRPAPRAPGCPDVVASLSQHLEGDLHPDACAKMERHLAECHTCRADCDSLRNTLALCRSVSDEPVPETIVAAVRQAVADYLKSTPDGE